MKKENEKQKKISVLNILLVLAVMVLLALTKNTITEIGYAIGTYLPDETTFESYCISKEYGEIVKRYLDYPAMKNKKKYQEYCAISEYYLENMLYQSAITNQKEKEADMHQKKIEEAQAKLGSHAYAAEEINAIFDKKQQS